MANEWKESAFARAFPEGCVRIAEVNVEARYEGWGGAIAYNPSTGKYLVAEYGHCSCNGPEETMSMQNEYDHLVDALRGSTYKRKLLAELSREVLEG